MIAHFVNLPCFACLGAELTLSGLHCAVWPSLMLPAPCLGTVGVLCLGMFGVFGVLFGACGFLGIKASLASSKVIGISVAPELGIVMEGSLKNKNYTFDLPLLILIISRFS